MQFLLIVSITFVIFYALRNLMFCNPLHVVEVYGERLRILYGRGLLKSAWHNVEVECRWKELLY